MNKHVALVAQFEAYMLEYSKFKDKEVVVSASRARKHLAELCKLAKEQRKDLQVAKEELKAKKEAEKAAIEAQKAMQNTLGEGEAEEEKPAE